MKTRNYWLLCVSTAALAAGTGTVASAQTDTIAPNSLEIETVVVTAEKRPERQQDIPMDVSSLTASKIEDLGGISSTQDLVQFLPGVTLIQSASSATSEINIRGAGQGRLPNSDAAVGLFRNDSYIAGGNLGGRTFQRFDLFDVDQIITLKGPQGALYGRNAVTGAVNVISKKADWGTNENWVQANVGSVGTAGLSGVYNLPVTDTFATRIGFDTETQTGCYYHYAPGSINGTGCYDFNRYAGGRFSAQYKPNDKLDVTFSADYASATGDPGIVITRGQTPLDVVLLSSPLKDTSSSAQANLNLGVSYDLGWATLTSTTNYRSRNGNLFDDPDYFATTTEQSAYDDHARMLYDELRLQGEAPQIHWLVGADLFFLTDDYRDMETGYALVVNMATMTTQDPNDTNHIRANQHSYGLYGSLQYDLTDKLSLKAEGRYSIDNKSELIDDYVNDPDNPSLSGVPQYSALPRDTTEGGAYYNWTWDGTVSYKITPTVLPYVRVGTSYRAGGFNAQLGVPCGPGLTPGVTCDADGLTPPVTYRPEHSITYEGGLKTSWLDHLLVINADIYWVATADVLANLNNGLPAMQNPATNAMFLENAGDATLLGEELEIVTLPPLPEGWGTIELDNFLSRQDGSFKNVPDLLQNAYLAGSKAVHDGGRLARIRPWSLQGNVTYRHPVFEEWALSFVTSYEGEWGGWQDGADTQLLGSYFILNSRIALENDHWSIAIKAQNLFNKDYYRNQSGAPTNGIGLYYVPGDKRYVEGAVTYRW